MSGPGAQASNLADGRSMRRDVSRRSVARASTSRPEDTKSTTTHNAPPRQRTAEDERARAAAKQAEKEMWERTRGAGSSVFKLAESGRIKREEREGEDADMWKAEDVLPTLEEVENKLYEIVEVPSIDVLLSRGICDYTLLPKTLGRGKFSTVFIASKNGELSAIKHTALFPHHQLISTRLLREPTLLAELPPHPNLVAVKETIRTPGHFYLVEEYLGGYVTLEALLPMLSDSQPPILPTPAAESILTQLLSAVHSIHVPLQICHRDIKPENILVHPETLQLKLLDFGLATHYSKSEAKLSTCCGSPAFHCPEIVKALASPPGSVMYMGPEVDAWTCGVTMLRCLTGQRFPLGASHSSLRGMAIRAQRAVSSIADEGLRNKVGALLDMDSTKRMRKFEELIAEQEKILGEPKKETKKFKSTTFIPIEPTHSIKLPVLAPHLTPEHSSAVGTHGMSTPYGPASTSRRTTPASSRPPSPNRSRSSTPTPPTQQSTQSANIVALNPTYQPPERILSYIKYCLRCAGILYHSWPDTSSFKGKSTPGSPVNYFGNQFPASSSGATLTASNTGFAEALASNHEYGHHPHHLHLHHNNSLDSAPVTPLFPPSLVPDERSDGFAHVQIFQCVMEVADEKEQKIQGGEQMSLVQSIMAAFGRKKPTPPPPSPSLRPDNRRSLSTPAKARVKDATLPPGTPGTSQTRPTNKDGSVRCLTFHLIVRFPKMNPTAAHSTLTGTTRLAPSRTNSSLSLSQQAASNNYTSHNRHSRANSVATPNHTYPEKASGSETGSDATSHDAKVNTKRVSYDGHVLNRVNSKQQQQQQQREGETPTLEINTDIPLHSHHLQQQAFPRTTSNRSPSSSRAPSRSRKRSTRGHQKKPRVYFEVSDYRAMQVIRDALSVGGTIDSLETEDYFSTNHQHRQSLPPSSDHQIGEVGTPLAETSEPLTPSRGDQRRKPRSRTSTSTSRTFLLADSDYGGGGGGGGTPRPSEDVETPRSSRMIASDEEERRGRQLNGKGAKLSKGGGVRAPSQLSTVALKEESPNNDSFKQSIESLNDVLQNIITSKLHNGAQSPGTPSSGSSGSEHAVSNTSIGSSTSSIPVLTAYMGGETGAQMQARTLLLEISRRLHSAETIGPNALEDLISPLSFTLFSALSPALGLEPQETKGLPCAGGAPPTNVGEAVTLRGLAMSALDIVARYASPREMYLAAQERLEVISLLREAKSMADEGEKETLQVPSGLPAANESSLQPESQLSSNNDNWSSGLETAGLLHFLSITIPRIKTQKPDNFVQPLLTLIPRAVRSSLRAKSISPLEGPFSHLSSPTNSNPQTPNTESNREMDNNGEESANQRIKAAAGEVTFSLSALIKSIKDWSDSFEKEEGEKAKTSMKTLLFACNIALVPELAKDHGYANLSDRQFHQWFPQYSFRRPTRRQYSSSSSLLQQQGGRHVPFNKSESSQASVWSCLEDLISNLNLDLEEYAFQRPKESLALQDSSAIAIVTMGAFILQVNLLSRERQTSRLPSNWTPEESLDKLKKAMPLLLASLGSGPPATISPDGSHSLGGSAHLSDTALTWILWCTHGLNQGKEPIILEESEILPLLQTTSSHAALCPDPSSRLISLTLVELLLDKNVTDELGIELLRDLIVESPFPQLKAASVGLAKRLISSDLSKGTSRYANRNFLQSISSSTFTFPSLAPEEPQEDFGASKTYLDDHGAWLSECLGFLYLLVAKDASNQTGILDESSINTIQSDLIQPLQNWLHRLTSSPLLSSPNNNNTSKEESELALQSTLLSVALDRAKEAIDSRPST